MLTQTQETLTALKQGKHTNHYKKWLLANIGKFLLVPKGKTLEDTGQERNKWTAGF